MSDFIKTFAVSLLLFAPEPGLSWWQWADDHNDGCSWSLLVVSSLHQSLRAEWNTDLFGNRAFQQLT